MPDVEVEAEVEISVKKVGKRKTQERRQDSHRKRGEIGNIRQTGLTEVSPEMTDQDDIKRRDCLTTLHFSVDAVVKPVIQISSYQRLAGKMLIFSF